jgi:hypothetical protein
MAKVVPTQDDLQAVMRLLDDSAIGKLAIGGGWARELSGLDEPRLHSDIDLVLTDPDPERLERFMGAVAEVAGKRSDRKRAFMFKGVMVELFLVYAA